jgi:LPXTG-motif cell wall-anchored protein
MRNTARTLVTVAGLVCMGTLCAPSAHAAFSQWNVTGNESGGNPINATVLFTTSAGFIDVKIQNLQNNPNGVAQSITDLFFTLNSGTTVGSSLSSSSGTERTINANGTYSIGPTVSTGWVLTTSGSTFHLDDLAPGAVGPEHAIIGDPGPGNVYSNAGGSIAGNNAHNPFLAGTVDFVVSISGVTANTQVTSAIFSFGTLSGNNKNATKAAPEAGSVLSLGGLLIGGGAGLWFRRRRSTRSK